MTESPLESVEILPRVGAVEVAHSDRREILGREAAPVDREAAAEILRDGLVVRARAAGAAMIELDPLVAPEIGDDVVFARNEPRPTARVIRPQRREPAAD